MDLKTLLKRKKHRTVVKAPEIKIGKHWSFEYGNYWDTLNKKPTKDFYFGVKFNINW